MTDAVWCVQAPQRERVTRDRRGSAFVSRVAARSHNWCADIAAAGPLTVPTLLMILTPRIVWAHAHAAPSRNAGKPRSAGPQSTKLT